MDAIQEGFDVFVHDGEKAFGAVRRVVVPISAVQDVSSEKVVLNCGKLDKNLKLAIGHAHQGEDPTIG